MHEENAARVAPPCVYRKRLDGRNMPAMATPTAKRAADALPTFALVLRRAHNDRSLLGS